MRIADVGHNAELRLGNAAEFADFARVIHAHFEHGHLGVVRNAENAKRQTNVVVEIADGFANSQADGEQSRDDVFGGGLAGAAGNGDNRACPTRRAQWPSCAERERVRHLQTVAVRS